MTKLVRYSAQEERQKREDKPARAWIDMTPDRADSMARHYVGGSQRCEKTGEIEPMTGVWGSRFKDHPWAIQSEREGWAKELRQCCVLGVKQRLMAGVKLDEIQIGDLMPEKRLIDYWADQARRELEAKEWREANMGHRSLGGLARSMPGVDR
jgi:hypothetical protein